MPASTVQVGTVLVGSKGLTTESILSVASGRAKVGLGVGVAATLTVRRAEIVAFIKRQNFPAYGFNRGFGHNVDREVAPGDVEELQLNLIRSHSAGVGSAAPREVVRAAMLLRAESLAQGHSGVRPEVVQKLVEFLNAGVTPHVPQFGSVGASGDLAPLSHIALALIGEGEGYEEDSESIEPIKKILARKKISPLKLEMKEGLALTNGVQFSTAIGLIAASKLRELLKTAVIATALTNQVMLGGDSSYNEKLLALRPHVGIQVVGEWLRSLIAGSPIREVHRDSEIDGEVQDPYNLRCAPQILGTCYDLIEEAIITFETEANSVTDNPLILAGKSGSFTEIISGGHFHGMPVAVKLYNLMQAMGIIASLSNVRCARYVDEHRNKGLGNDLIWPKLSEKVRATSSGMMIPEYVSAALTNSIWGAAMPSHLMSISTDAGQEDHVSMSATLAVRVLETIPRVAEVLAIELAFASQAAAIRRELQSIPAKGQPFKNSAKVEKLLRSAEKEANRQLGNSAFKASVGVSFEYGVPAKSRLLSPICEKVLKTISEVFKPVVVDRALSGELKELAALVQSGKISMYLERRPEHRL